MKKFIVIISLIILCVAYFYMSCKQNKESNEHKIAQTLLQQIDSFISIKNIFLNEIKNDSSEKKLQQTFLQLRLSYKKVEWAVEYFTPANARQINGAPVDEVEKSGTIYEPSGLQVIESFVFPKCDLSKKNELITQLEILQNQSEKVKDFFTNIDLFDWQIFDAIKLEVFRIETLGITGFDNPITLNSMNESAASLQSIKSIIHLYIQQKDEEQILIGLDNSINYLQNNQNFNSFNRAEFIRHYANPITISITALEKKLNIHEIIYSRLLNQDAKTLFDTDAFNSSAYTLNNSMPTQQQIELGKKLFNDKILSGNNVRSCASCHQPDKAFTDGLMKNTELNSNKLLVRNTPTLLNAALQPAQFYDLRANTLEEQAIDVINNKHEMNSSLKSVATKLWNNNHYKNLFSEAFPKQNRNNIDSSEILAALTFYVRTLISLNSRFDKYMRGDDNALNKNEVNGFNIFMGKAKCATCHYMPLFNGNFPPRYVKIDAEVIGVPSTKNLVEVDSDKGEYNIIKVASLLHAFKTPRVRNAARTAPYMHNGVFNSLQEVIDFYDKGGGAGFGLRVENQTLPFDKLDLTKQEKKDLIGFIQSLDD